MFYNQQDVAGGIMFYHKNATVDDFNKKCADLEIADLTWRCFGSDCVFFYIRKPYNEEYEDSEDEDDDSEDEEEDEEQDE